MVNERFNVVGTNIAEKATVIWNVADMLRGPFKPHEYGLVILPMTVVKRFHDCLLPTHNAVLEQYEKVKKFAVMDGFLTKASGYQFYNTSKYTFDSLLADPENIEVNFRDYLNGFSANVQDVLAKFDFDNIIKRMVESNTLYLVIKEFNSQKGYLGPDKISAVDCGYIFEDLVKRFSESFGEEAGAHFTSRDVIYLMTDILLSDADLSKGGNVTVYDMTMGTSQMLSCMEERIHELNSEIDVTCFGQEFNPSTFAIAKADMMIRGGDPNNMRFGDTLSEDQFSGYQFQYIISNPPFGIDWKREQKAVEAEAAKGELGRFAPGLPKISDGQQLFVLNGLSKLALNGKMAIIQNGSPMFSGDAGSGPSEIRRYIIENDWLDAIIQLSTDMFMNTGLSTYIWVLNKNKPKERIGRIQLIDASHCAEERRKPIGTKRKDITDRCRELVARAYGEFRNDVIYGDKNGVFCHSKIFDSIEFGYRKIVIEQPERDEDGKVILKKGKPVADAKLRDTDTVPLSEDINEYFKQEVLPYAPDSWIDTKKTKIGYEIPMTRVFYHFVRPRCSKEILLDIQKNEELRRELLTKMSSYDFAEIVSEDTESCENWFSQLPETWKTEIIKSLFVNRSEKVSDTEYEPLSVTKGGILPQIEGVAKTSANDERKLVRKGDFVINSRSDRKQSSGVADRDGSVSLINIILEPINRKDILPEYREHLLKNYGFAEEFYRWGHGIVADLWTTRWEEMKQISVPIPPISVQEKIVDILKVVNEITKTEKTISELYTDYRNSLVYELVTRKKEVK